MKLNIGCGAYPRYGWINLDLYKEPWVDIQCDLNKGKLPFEDSCCDYILASHVLEHLDNWEPIMLEAYRVLKPGGLFEIHVPYCLEGLHSPYHRHVFMKDTIDFYFTRNTNTQGLQPHCDFIKLKQKANWLKIAPLGYWHLNKWFNTDFHKAFIPRKRYEWEYLLQKPSEAIIWNYLN